MSNVLLAFFFKTDNKKFLSMSLVFSTGVMIYVSMVEIFFKSKDALSVSFGMKTGTLITIVGFFGGMFLIGLIDRLIPDEQNYHEIIEPVPMDSSDAPVRRRN